MDDIKVIQDLKIFQQIISKCADGKNTIVVIYVGNISINGNNGDGKFDFASYLDSLPVPKFTSLRREAIKIAKEKYQTDEAAATYLGGTRRMLSHEKEKLNEEVI